jgi:tetratricopeptide (TPR) repeat protein
VNYEEVVRQPDRVIKSLIVNKLGLPWEERSASLPPVSVVTLSSLPFPPSCRRVLSFHTSNRSVHTHSMGQVRQGLYVTAIGKWVKFKKQLEPIRKLLLPRLKEMLARGQLPFPDQINWLLDPDYDYHGEGEGRTRASAEKTIDPATRSSDSVSSGEKKKSSQLDSPPSAKPKTPSSPSTGGGRKRTSLVDQEGEGELEQEPKKAKKAKRRASSSKGSGAKKAKRQRRSRKKQRQSPSSSSSRKAKKSDSRKRSSSSSSRQQSEKRSPTPRPTKRTISGAPPSAKLSDPASAPESPSRQSSRRAAPTITREEIASLSAQVKAAFPAEVVRHLEAIRSSLPYLAGDPFLDELGAVTVALFNLGKLKECVQLSQQILRFNASLHSVSVALGSALAMDGKLEESLVAMNALVSDRSRDGLEIGSDVYERRAQVLMALGETNSSIADLTRAIKIAPNANSYSTRASAFIRYPRLPPPSLDPSPREQRYWDAKKDAMAAVKLGANTPQLWNMIGRCEREFGEPEKAIAAQTKALQLESTHKESLLELAVTYMSVSNARKALEFIEKVLALDPQLKHAHGYKGLLFQNMGRARETIAAFREAYLLDPTDTQALQFTAISHQALGEYEAAIEWFEKTLAADPDHYSWCLREIAYYRWRMLDTPLGDYNPDTDIHWLLKVRPPSSPPHSHSARMPGSGELLFATTVVRAATPGAISSSLSTTPARCACSPQEAKVCR